MMMKQLVALLLISASAYQAQAQIEKPVKWSYGVKRLSDEEAEIHLLASVQDGWHIYAQKQPGTGIATPTKILFTKADGVKLIGVPTEIGKKEMYTEKSLGISDFEYSGKVDFVQKVKLKPSVKEVKGKITFQTCTHEMCLPTETIDFTVPIPQK